MILKYYVDEIRAVLKLDQSDIEHDERLIIRWLNSQRALFIKNEVNKGNTLTHTAYQTLNSLKLILVSGAMTNYFSTDAKYLTTEKKLPKILEAKGMLKVKSIRMPELGGKELNLVNPEKVKYSGNGKFNSREIYATYYKNRFYIKNKEGNKDIENLNFITVDAIFENPLDLVNVIDAEGLPMYNIDVDDYPINDNLWEYMLGAIRNNRFLLMEQIRDKQDNDDSQDR